MQYSQLNFNENISIEIDTAEEFCKTLASKRGEFYYSRYLEKYLLEEAVFLEDEVSDVDGRYVTRLKNVEFEYLLRCKDSQYMYIFLSGARSDIERKSHFLRWKYERMLDGNVLIISDPMYRLYNELKLGWYYGNSKEDYLDYTKELIMKIAERLKIRRENIILYGSSGGGYAALQLASRIGKCVGIGYNPQLFLQNFQYAKTFEKIVGVDLTEEDIYHRNDVCWQIEHEDNSKYMIIVNCQSSMDYEKQLIPFCRRFHLIPQYGVQQHNNIVLWTFEASDGVLPEHNVGETKNIFRLIMYLAEYIRNGGNFEYLEGLYQIINELWNESYSMCKSLNVENRELIAKLEKVYETNSLIKRIAKVYDCEKKKIILYPYGVQGEKVKTVLNEVFEMEEIYIVDNKKAGINNIISLDDLVNINVMDYTFLITSDNPEIYDELRNSLYQYVPKENIFDLFPR